MTEMKTKVAVVTGGNGVLGGAIAMGFAKKRHACGDSRQE